MKGDDVYRGVFAVLMLPITHPDRYISLRYTDVDDKEQEIGVIECLDGFADAQQKLIRANLVKQYYEQVIRRVYDVDYKYGLLFFHVETERGDDHFVMPWRYDRAEDFGATGKVLLDALGNRFIIRDVAQLPIKDRRVFTSFIYW